MHYFRYNYLLQRHIFARSSAWIFFFLLSSVTFSQVNEEAASRLVNIDINQVTLQLAQAPMENSRASKTGPMSFSIPMPDGNAEIFNIVESPIMHPDFAAAYPDFKTYSVQSIAHPEVSGRISITPYGFNAMILSTAGVIYIRPLDLLFPRVHEVSLSKMDDVLDCGMIEDFGAIQDGAPLNQAVANGTTKRTYTLAIVGTGEFHDANGGTVAAARAVAMTSVNAIQAIFERELAVAFNLLTPFIYTNANTDPFNPGLDRVVAAAEAVETNFSGQGYDIGHVFHDQDQGAGNLNTGGIANLAAVCSNGAEGNGFRKAGGWSSSFDNVTPGWIKLATHEFGHMFDMPHTFNGDGFNCTTGNHPLNTAYEIGSGTTIMSYQGICDDQYNIPSSGLADHYFHANSLDRAVTYMNTQTCHAGVATGNAPPVVTADICNSGPYSIPLGTPFRLTGSGTDANGDQIYYCWEQYDEDGANADPTHGFIGPTAAASTIAPLFRSYPPTTSPSRTFPNIDLIRTNQYASSFEPLPTVARTLNFRLTARDWKGGGGGVDCKPLTVTVNNSGPLFLGAPNGGETLIAGNNTTVGWNVANTNILSATVNIRLSIDGGKTFPYTLATATPNDGSQMVPIPAGVANTTTARMMVESAANTCVVFFDISDADFTITSNCQVATSSVCPTTPVNLTAGNAGLNLTMNEYFGGKITQANYNLNGNDPSTLIANLTVAGGNVCQTPGTGWTNTLDFAVSATGTYSLNADPNDNDFIIFSVFDAATFNAATPCASFLGSNSNGAYGLSGGAVNVALTECTMYKLVMWSLNETIDGFISINGSGDVYAAGPNPGAGYAYTYAAINTANNQIAAVSAAANFTTLPGGNYQVFGASYSTAVNPANWVGQSTTQILSGGSCVLFSSNSRPVNVTGTPCANPPTVNAPTVTQPTCPTPTGTIVVNATGAGALEYSVNNGATYQATSTFANLAPGNYNIVVRLQADPGCTTAYAQNPVVLNAPTGCMGNCTDYPVTGLNLNIPDNTPAGVTSTINVPTAGTITDINVKGLNGNHTYVGALTFILQSPMGTSITLITSNNACNATSFNISLDDQAANPLTCLDNAGNTVQPQNALSGFNGQNAQGNWVLTVADGDAFNDQGTLNGWTLEVCVQGAVCTTPMINTVIATQPTCATPNGSIVVNATGTGTLEYSVNNGTTYQASNNFGNLAPGNYNISVRIQGSNPVCSAAYTQNPVVLNAPTGCGGNCTDYVANDVPLNIPDNNPTGITSTISVPTGGTITDVNIKNLNGTHAYLGDLTFTLMSPMGTSIVLIQNLCDNDNTGFDIGLDDQAGGPLNCPLSDMATEQPANPLSVLNGQNPIGNWTLKVVDAGAADVGVLNGWTLNICTSGGGGPCPPTLAKNEMNIASGTYQAGTQLTSSGSVGAGNNVTFRAGNNIELQPNFSVPQTSVFEAKIEGCQ